MMKRISKLLLLASLSSAIAHANNSTPSVDRVLDELSRQYESGNKSTSLALNSPLIKNSSTKTTNPNIMGRLNAVASNSVSNFTQYGIASWSGKKKHGNTTTSGERFNMYAMTASHKTLPMNSIIKVTNQLNGKTVVVKINDRGSSNSKILDLSYGAAKKIGMTTKGSGKVSIKRIAL